MHRKRIASSGCGSGEGERTIPAWRSVMTLVWRSCAGGYQISAAVRPLRRRRSAQALTRPPGFDRARLLDAKGFRAGGCGGLFPHSNRLNMADRTSTMITMRVYQIASPSAIVVPEAPVLAMLVSCIQSIRKASWRDGVPLSLAAHPMYPRGSDN